MSEGDLCHRSNTYIQNCIDRNTDYDDETCACVPDCNEPICSPIVIDVLGNGFSLTNAAEGVRFDLNNDGVREPRGWTTIDTDDAWLALDRNGDGTIDGGKELFGNATPQDLLPEGQEANGFQALTLYDGLAYGGNGDGKITAADEIFDRLKLWQDANHNGISESCELFSLSDLGLRKIDLDYRKSRRTDLFGNEFRYRSKVRDAQDAHLGRWAWDVFLVTQPQ